MQRCQRRTNLTIEILNMEIMKKTGKFGAAILALSMAAFVSCRNANQNADDTTTTDTETMSSEGDADMSTSPGSNVSPDMETTTGDTLTTGTGNTGSTG